MIDMLTDPRRAFDRMRVFDAGRTATAYVAILASALVLLVAYFRMVDFSWLQRTLLERLGPDQRGIAENVLTPGVLLVSSIGGRIVKTTIWFCLLAFVYDVAGRALRSERTYADWLQFVVLSSLPLILLLPLGVASMLLSPVIAVLPGQLDTTSLAFVIAAGGNSRWNAVLSQLSLVQFWIAGIQVVGIATWLGIGAGRAFAIVALPYVACLAGATFLALL